MNKCDDIQPIIEKSKFVPLCILMLILAQDPLAAIRLSLYPDLDFTDKICFTIQLLVCTCTLLFGIQTRLYLLLHLSILFMST